VPDLREAMIVLGMEGARPKPQDPGVRLGPPLRPRMEQHLAGLAGPADGLPLDIVDMANVVREMIAPRGLAGGGEPGVGRGGVGSMLAHARFSRLTSRCGQLDELTNFARPAAQLF